MNVEIIGYVALFAVSAVLCLGSIPRARTIQHPESRAGFVALLASVAVWSGGYIGYLLAPTVRAKLAFYILGFSFAFVAVVAWLYFCSAYTGRSPRHAPFRNTLVGVFGLLIALKITNPVHHLYFTAEWTADPFPHLAIQHQLLYWIVLGFSYVIVAVGFFMLFERFHYTGANSRPLLVLVGITGVPALATILGDQLEWLLPLMYEPPGVALFAVGTLFVYKERLETIRLTGETDKPAIYLDRDGRVRDYNQAAASILPTLEGSIGGTIDGIGSAALSDDDQGIHPVTVDGETRLYEVSKTPFQSSGVPTGYLLTLTDVTDRESYRERLEETTEQLEALNRVVRHDIRNDMAVIIGWAEILGEHVDEDGDDALQRVLEKSRDVIELTEISRDFVESLTDDGTAELRPVALRQVIDGELAAVRDSYQDAAFRVSGDVPDVSVRANGMLSSVFRNLFENAVKHNDEDTPTVTITYADRGETVRVRIADNGPGIPDDRKQRVFGKGEKGIESAGTGMGMYLVDTLVDQFGGDVWIEDNDPKGAIVVVELAKWREETDDAEGE